jgi:hypothetical protein
LSGVAGQVSERARHHQRRRAVARDEDLAEAAGGQLVVDGDAVDRAGEQAADDVLVGVEGVCTAVGHQLPRQVVQDPVLGLDALGVEPELGVLERRPVFDHGIGEVTGHVHEGDDGPGAQRRGQVGEAVDAPGPHALRRRARPACAASTRPARMRCVDQLGDIPAEAGLEAGQAVLAERRARAGRSAWEDVGQKRGSGAR